MMSFAVQKLLFLTVLKICTNKMMKTLKIVQKIKALKYKNVLKIPPVKI